jgi:L-fuconolactonase
VDLLHPDLVPHQLARWQQHPVFCGVRHLVHTDPRPDLLDLPEVRRSLAVVAERGLSLDVPDAWPRHMRQLRDVARAVPGLRVVVDHLGKPPTDPREQRQWRQGLAEVAALPNTVAKVSGLQHLHRGRDGVEAEASLRPVWDAALELFGPERLMYGGDWPMTVPVGGYEPAWAATARLVGELSPPEQDRVLAGTAAAVYGLAARTGPRRAGGHRCLTPATRRRDRTRWIRSRNRLHGGGRPMLTGISPILTGELLAFLDAMGHSDAVVIADAHFPAERIASRLVLLPTLGSPRSSEPSSRCSRWTTSPRWT